MKCCGCSQWPNDFSLECVAYCARAWSSYFLIMLHDRNRMYFWGLFQHRIFPCFKFKLIELVNHEFQFLFDFHQGRFRPLCPMSFSNVLSTSFLCFSFLIGLLSVPSSSSSTWSMVIEADHNTQVDHACCDKHASPVCSMPCKWQAHVLREIFEKWQTGTIESTNNNIPNLSDRQRRTTFPS